VTTTSHHRRTSSAGLLPVIGAAVVGAALGAGTMALARPHSPNQQLTALPGPGSGAASDSMASSDTVPSSAGASTRARTGSAEPVRPIDPVAFSPPITDAAGMSMTVLRPEKVKGGVRLTVALVNTNDVPITIDTGAIGPRNPRFNNVVVPLTMTPARKRLAPGEGYTYQCVIRLPSTNVGQLSFVVGMASLTGQVAGD
jgi:hypothetical protein